MIKARCCFHLFFLLLFFITSNAFSSSEKDFPVENVPVEESFNDEKPKQKGFVGFKRVTKKSSPKLYSVVTNLSKKFNMKTPPVVLVFEGNLFSKILNQLGVDLTCNACAMSLTQGFSLICLGSDLVDNLPINQMKGIIAH